MDKNMERIKATTECGNDDDDDDDPIGAALQNPIIVQAILSHLDTKNVKEGRRVCKVWEVEGTINLGKQGRLPLHRLFNDYKTTTVPMPVNSKLLQRISIRSSGSEIFNGRQFPDNVATLCFNSFASLRHNLVQEIHFDMDEDICEGLPAALNAYAFPNLTKITTWKKKGIHPEDSNLPLRPINTLKELYIVGDDFLEGYNYPLLQNMINSAPELEVLDIYGNFYPNLASCRTLKVLKWYGRFTLYIGSQQIPRVRAFEVDQVFGMVNEVGERLEHLALGLLVLFPIAQRRFHEFKKCFPKLPKLKSLKLFGVDFLRMEGQICPALLPNLEIISLSVLQSFVNRTIDDQEDEDADDDDEKDENENEGGYLTHEGVTSLGLFDVDCVDRITVASKRFPNVNRLAIRIASLSWTTTGKFLGTILQACSTWSLLYLKIQIPERFKLSELLKGLKSLSVLEGIKQVRIFRDQFFNSRDIDDDLQNDCQELKEVLQLSARMDSMIFKNLAVKATTKETVFEYLNEHKDLPVFYLD